MRDPDKAKWITALLKPLFLAIIFSFQMGFAQNDSLQDSLSLPETQIKVKQFIIPAAMFYVNLQIIYVKIFKFF